MKITLITISAAICLGSSGCVAGPGGTYNAANRTIAGVGIGAVLGGVVGSAVGDPFSAAIMGAVAGGGIGAVMDPTVFDRDTRGYCYTVDAQGNPVSHPADSVECKTAAAAQAGAPIPAQ